MSGGEVIRLVIMACAAYLIGNINPAIIIGKLKGIDIRKEGSGNAGMTNSIRVMGLGAGIAVFVVDVLKAFISVKIGFSFCGAAGAMAAPILLASCIPASRIMPVVTAFMQGPSPSARRIAAPAAVAVHWAVGVRCPPYSSGSRNCLSAPQKCSRARRAGALSSRRPFQGPFSASSSPPFPSFSRRNTGLRRCSRSSARADLRAPFFPRRSRQTQ